MSAASTRTAEAEAHALITRSTADPAISQHVTWVLAAFSNAGPVPAVTVVIKAPRRLLAIQIV